MWLDFQDLQTKCSISGCYQFLVKVNHLIMVFLHQFWGSMRILLDVWHLESLYSDLTVSTNRYETLSLEEVTSLLYCAVFSCFSPVRLLSDCSLPGSSVHGILQARILEWVAMPSSRGSSQPRNWTHISCVSCIADRFFTYWVTWEVPQVCYPWFNLFLCFSLSVLRKLMQGQLQVLVSTLIHKGMDMRNNEF